MFAKQEPLVPLAVRRDNSRDCQNEVICPNCAGSHNVFNKDCTKWLLEKSIQHIRAEKGTSHRNSKDSKRGVITDRASIYR